MLFVDLSLECLGALGLSKFGCLALLELQRSVDLNITVHVLHIPQTHLLLYLSFQRFVWLVSLVIVEGYLVNGNFILEAVFLVWEFLHLESEVLLR